MNILHDDNADDHYHQHKHHQPWPYEPESLLTASLHLLVLLDRLL
jgi:hypothetical protein